MSSKEISMHPALVRNLRIIAREAPDKVKPAKIIFDRLQEQLVKNCHTHTLHDDRGDEVASILVTQVSTDDLGDHNTSPSHDTKPTSSSEEMLQLAGKRRLSVGIMPGFAPPQQGGPLDNDRVRQATDIIGHAITKGQAATVLLHGLVIARGSRLGWNWTEAIKEDGFNQHALVYGDALGENAQNTLTVIYGESMGSINAAHTAQRMAASDNEVLLYAQNPPGPDSPFLPSWLKSTQTVAGYLGESAIRRIIKGFEKITPKTIDEKPFFHGLYADLEERGIIRPENSQQQKRKWRATLIDLRNLMQEIPFSTGDITVPTIVNYGWKDPTSFTLERMRLWKKGERESIKGIIQHRLSDFAHTPEYNPMRWVNALGD